MAESRKRARPPVDQRHFQTLRTFGQEAQVARMSEDQQRKLWAITCKAAKLPVVPLEAVRESYMTFLQGEAAHARLLCKDDGVAPGLVRVSTTYRNKIVAAVTMPVEALMSAILPTFRRHYPTDEEALVVLLELFEASKLPRKRRSE